MCRRWFIVLTAVCVAACASIPPGPPTLPPPSHGSSNTVTPANIRRVRADFPPGYEVAELTGGRSPAGYWGLGSDWTAEPAPCAALTDPVTGDAAPLGLSGSGDGGIIYAVVVAVVPPSTAPQRVADCPRWSMRSRRTTATVALAPAPPIVGVNTMGMTTTARTTVEGGTETVAQIYTAVAYLGDYLAFVVVATDPGSTKPALPVDFAAKFLVKVVATLRG